MNDEFHAWSDEGHYFDPDEDRDEIDFVRGTCRECETWGEIQCRVHGDAYIEGLRTKDSPDVIAAWQHMVECARAFVRCADEFSDDIGATAEHYDALERAQERLARAWDGERGVEVSP